ncbi:MAG: maleylpyruvate isomerase family mycothiol-dependent enzyme [Microthrixaceae bacterium]
MGRGWSNAGAARARFADLVESLTDAQLAGETLCEGWTPKEVLGHVVSFVDLSFPRFMAQVVKARFNFDVASDRMARTLAERPVEDLLATLRANADKSSAVPMFPEDLTVLDATAHAQDVRRGLGLDTQPDAEVVREMLEFMASGKAKPIFDAKVTQGLTIAATDVDFRHGDGPEVEATAEALMMSLLNRPSVFSELSGMGVGKLVSRLTAE